MFEMEQEAKCSLCKEPLLCCCCRSGLYPDEGIGAHSDLKIVKSVDCVNSFAGGCRHLRQPRAGPEGHATMVAGVAAARNGPEVLAKQQLSCLAMVAGYWAVAALPVAACRLRFQDSC